MNSLDALLPYHSFDPDGNVFVLADGSLGVAWSLSPPEVEGGSESQLGAVASRVEAMLRLLPERSAVQVILTMDRDIRRRVAAWRAAGSAGLHQDLTSARIRALEEFC